MSVYFATTAATTNEEKVADGTIKAYRCAHSTEDKDACPEGLFQAYLPITKRRRFGLRPTSTSKITQHRTRPITAR